MFGFGFTYNTTNPLSDGGGFDPDAEAFFTASGITDTTQKNAVNQLVLDLKSYNIWSKMTALYPIVGGNASSHAVNLKTPGTYNLSFTTGWTHASTGMTPVSAYANTSITTTTIGLNSGSLGFYSRTNNTFQGGDIGTFDPFSASYIYTYISGSPTNRDYRYTENAGVTRLSSPTRTDGFMCVSRTSSTLIKGYRNGSIEVSNNATTATNLGTGNIYLGAFNFYGGSPFYSNRELAFGYVSTGLTDTEVTNFYTAVQAYQTTLGRSVGTQTVSDSDAQAFVTAASIQDQVEATAVNNLVIGLKEDSLWTKMKALYPIVGGTASSHAVNLKTPGTYNLTFSTGWTHASTGITPNGAAYADTNFIPKTNGTVNSSHISIYSRTNVAEVALDFGGTNNTGSTGATQMYIRLSNTFKGCVDFYPTSYAQYANSDSRGFYEVSRTASNSQRAYKNGVYQSNNTNSGNQTTVTLYIGAEHADAGVQYYSTKQFAFASIGDGLNDTESSNLYTRVQNFQTSLNRQI